MHQVYIVYRFEFSNKAYRSQLAQVVNICHLLLPRRARPNCIKTKCFRPAAAKSGLAAEMTDRGAHEPRSQAAEIQRGVRSTAQ